MELKEAYDIKLLGKRLEDKGLDLAEEASAIVLEEVLAWVAESAQKSETPFDDIVASVLPLVKTEVLKIIDTIDGEEG
jgi:hypothetical protein